MLIDEFLCKREVLGKRAPHSFTPPLSVVGVSNMKESSIVSFVASVSITSIRSFMSQVTPTICIRSFVSQVCGHDSCFQFVLLASPTPFQLILVEVIRSVYPSNQQPNYPNHGRSLVVL
jgi:hypothetical protein